MCVMSMVMDYYEPLIPVWPQPDVRDTMITSKQHVPVIISHEEAKLLLMLISEFKEAVEAAAKVDRLTGQPDCVDPKKQQLLERVAVLEMRLECAKSVLQDQTQ